MHTCPNTGLSIPVPEGWFISEKEHSLYNSCLITREPYERIRTFFTGLEVNVYRNYKNRARLRPTQFASKEIKACEERFEVRPDKFHKDALYFSFSGLLINPGILAVHPNLGLIPISLQSLLYLQMKACNLDDIVYQLTFHSTPTTWRKDKPISKAMLENWKDISSLRQWR